jgi:Na+/proline symporter
MTHTPLVAQIFFFGALLSAVMSTASATLLAPSVTFTENVLKKLLRRELDDRRFLLTMRLVVAAFAIGVTLFALNSDSTIYEMVVGAYKVTLVAAFVPLAAGLYWRRATSQGALAAIVGGLVTWVALEIIAPDGLFPPQLAGLLVSVAGMVAGSLAPQWYGKPPARSGA